MQQIQQQKKRINVAISSVMVVQYDPFFLRFQVAIIGCTPPFPRKKKLYFQCQEDFSSSWDSNKKIVGICADANMNGSKSRSKVFEMMWKENKWIIHAI